MKPNTEYYHKRFTISGANICNNLLKDIQESQSIAIFKTVVFKLLLSKP